MTRLIDADSLDSVVLRLNTEENAQITRGEYKLIDSVIFEFPTVDAVPVIRCEDCKWGREISGNIECNADMNNPPEYHGYEWFCPLGERKDWIMIDK